MSQPRAASRSFKIAGAFFLLAIACIAFVYDMPRSALAVTGMLFIISAIIGYAFVFQGIYRLVEQLVTRRMKSKK
ncbi:hypothetical protein [Arcanobacterium pinnipediorum]|uniref:Uncharacterized protein n=1 Tax=Arcanobacterium pinnipediorum TaxID=1503041 RepID=A0ABY5AIM9_9ACTO|nr:hypothetical protein [Arcanobacterium pinnipediorum]USR79840.1 hypothetical protein NG665_02320 [Arcanobacterium pinnipediorum]